MSFLSTRRRVLEYAAFGFTAGAFKVYAPPGAAATEGPEPPSRRLFFRDPDRSSVSLSPDGQNISWREPRDGVLNLMVAPINDLTQARPVTNAKDRSVSESYIWAWTNKHIVFFDSVGDENYRAYSVDLDTGTTIPLTPSGGVRSYVQQRSKRFPSELLFGVNARDRKLFDIVRIDIASGESQPIFQNPGFTSIRTGIDFQVYLGTRFLADGSAKVQKLEPGGTWTDFADIGPEDALTTGPAMISGNRKSVFFIDSRGRDTAALVEIDLATGERQVLAEDPEADISRVLYEPGSLRPYAATSVAARQHWRLIDPAFGFDLDHWRAGQPGSDFSVESQSNEGGRIVLDYFRPDAADGFCLYEREARKLTPLFKSRTDLDQVALRPMEPVIIPASDGVPLPGYLTLPKDNVKNVPFVLAIHGGPYYRDTWGYNEIHQFLASRGYGVLSVNYRGSTGFGKRFVNLADKGWGGRMQDDLTDAAGWAIAQGYADPKRIGFFGESYGGYAALTAATKTPDTFACVIDLFGPSNLVTMMRSFPPYWTWLSTWKRRLADPETEDGRAWLTERSPLTHADKIVRPLLIGQGMRDVRVTPKESEQIVQAMQERRIPVTYVTFPDEGHGFVRQENRVAFSAVAEAFLAKHLDGQAEPIGDALAGSTIKFEVGRELIPGLG